MTMEMNQVKDLNLDRQKQLGRILGRNGIRQSGQREQCPPLGRTMRLGCCQRFHHTRQPISLLRRWRELRERNRSKQGIQQEDCILKSVTYFPQFNFPTAFLRYLEGEKKT